MGKHRTARKYTGAVKLNTNSGLGKSLLNTRKNDEREHRMRIRSDPGDYAEAVREAKFSGRSYVDDTDFAELVARAVAEGDEFVARKNTKLIYEGGDEDHSVRKFQVTATKEQNEFMTKKKDLLRIPRRPIWIGTKKVDQEGHDWIEETNTQNNKNKGENYDSESFDETEEAEEEMYEDLKDNKNKSGEEEEEEEEGYEELENLEDYEEGEEYSDEYKFEDDLSDSIDWNAVAEELGIEDEAGLTSKRKKLWKWQRDELEKEAAEKLKNETENGTDKKNNEENSDEEDNENKKGGNRMASKKNKIHKGRAKGMNPNRRRDVFQTAEQRLKEAIEKVPKRENVGEAKIVSYILSPEELKKKELEEFCRWRRDIMELETDKVVTLTPFEKNIQMWRQLWHVVERSDIVIQVVDGRNPMLFRSADLVRYVGEVSLIQQKIYNQVTKRNQPPKRSLLILNKADLIPLQVRMMWSAYFRANGIEHVFFSALREEILLKVCDQLRKFNMLEADEEKRLRMGETSLSEVLAKLKKADVFTKKRVSDGLMGAYTQTNDNKNAKNDKELAEESFSDEENLTADEKRDNDRFGKPEDITAKERVQREKELESILRSIDEDIAIKSDDFSLPLPTNACMYSPRIITREQLLALLPGLKPIIKGHRENDNITSSNDHIVVGTVGYPNVGKSSIINVLSIETGIRTTVSSTPGKTKHFQTINLNDKIMLCDCPGLVFPSFTHTRGDLVCAGILPIDHERDYLLPMKLLAARIPARVFEKIYKINIPIPDKYTTTEVPVGLNKNERYATAEQIVSAFCSQKGFNGLNGGADSSRAIRIIMKDLYSGKLLWLALPPPLKPQQIKQVSPAGTVVEPKKI